MKTKIIAVAGPTASGKTSLAIEIAKRISGEVISNDSMQIYKGMEIGTAAPTMEEMQGVPHHLIGIISPESEFSCSDYSALAREKIEEITKRGRVPVFCGGTGLYLDSILARGEMSESEKDESLRAELCEYAERHGADALHERLSKADPEAALSIHKNNVRRVVRALEIYLSTGITKTEWDRRSTEAPLPYDVTMAVIDFADREKLYARIGQRVDLMVKAGVVEEAMNIWKSGYLSGDKPCAQAIGYKEFVPYFEGEEALETAIEAIKLNTRRYAKRQITWFKKYRDAIRLIPDSREGELKSAEQLACEFLERSGFSV